MFDIPVFTYNAVVCVCVYIYIYIYMVTCLTAWNMDDIKFAISQ